MPTIDTSKMGELPDAPIEDPTSHVEDQLQRMAAAIGGRVVNRTGASLNSADMSSVAVPATPVQDTPIEIPYPDVVIPDVDKQEFLRALLSGEPFTKSFELFGGAVTVVFQTRTVAVNDVVRHTKTVLDQQSMRDRVTLIASVRSFTVGGQQKLCDPVDPVTTEHLVHLVTDMCAALNDITYAAVRDAFFEFEELCEVMYRRASHRPFWTATDGAR